MNSFPFVPIEITNENMIAVSILLLIISILGAVANYLYKKGKLYKILYTNIGEFFNIKKKKTKS